MPFNTFANREDPDQAALLRLEKLFLFQCAFVTHGHFYKMELNPDGNSVNYLPFMAKYYRRSKLRLSFCPTLKELFPTMWCVGPAKPQISLRIPLVLSEPLLVA